MNSGAKTIKLRIGGMSCVGCQNKIQKKLCRTKGIQAAKVNYDHSNAVITYDPALVHPKDIHGLIQKLGYEVLSADERQATDRNRTIGLLIIVFALYVLMQRLGILNLLVPGTLAEEHMGYGMMFVLGIVTSVHCVAMCGGINLSQCLSSGKSEPGRKNRFSVLRPAFLYNFGRVVSYTAIGFLAGALGSAFTFSTTFQGVLKLTAGIFMLIMGLNMLGIFPWLRRLQPRMPKSIANRVDKGKAKSKSQFVVGLLNGLMPCGPLQAMQIYALSTGSPFAGAVSMFLFSLGTVPLMFGLGALSSALSKRFTKKIMTAGAVLVMVFGLFMLSQGWNLSGFSVANLVAGITDAETPGDTANDTDVDDSSKTNENTENNTDAIGGDENENDVPAEDGVQLINSSLSARGGYPTITVEAGIPVKWTLNAPQGSLNGCNNAIYIPEYEIEVQLKSGDNIIEFTPTETGRFSYSCWMGMLRGTINVVGAGEKTSAQT